LQLKRPVYTGLSYFLPIFNPPSEPKYRTAETCQTPVHRISTDFQVSPCSALEDYWGLLDMFYRRLSILRSPLWNEDNIDFFYWYQSG
jgi:hypothetical protein